MVNYQEKYIKYKKKYLELKQIGNAYRGVTPRSPRDSSSSSGSYTYTPDEQKAIDAKNAEAQEIYDQPGNTLSLSDIKSMLSNKDAIMKMRKDKERKKTELLAELKANKIDNYNFYYNDLETIFPKWSPKRLKDRTDVLLTRFEAIAIALINNIGYGSSNVATSAVAYSNEKYLDDDDKEIVKKLRHDYSVEDKNYQKTMWQEYCDKIKPKKPENWRWLLYMTGQNWTNEIKNF
jgi:hypothetical protein